MAEPASAATAFGNVFRRELAFAWRSLLAWLIPGMAMIGLTASMQPEMSKEGSLFAAKLDMVPKEILVAFGVQGADFGEPASYLATNFTVYALIGSAFAGILGATVLAKEEAFGTGEMLYTMPVARRTVVLAKVAAGLVLVELFALGLAVAAFGTFAAIGVTLARPAVLAAMFVVAGALFAAMFALGLLITVRSSRPRSATSAALGLIFGLYGLNVVGALNESLSAFRAVSPFRYAEAARVIQAGGLPAGTLVLVAVALVAVGIVCRLFDQKDIHA
jgi:ABC-2 type transport system permease protein